MSLEIRAEVAGFYDLEPDFPNDIPFYAERTTPETDVLELGCGTGRVLAPVAKLARFSRGIDASEAMLSICRDRLKAEGIDESRAEVSAGNVTGFDLGRQFDLVTAPYRVFQNLETDGEIAGFFRCARAHLKPGGSLIVTVFNPRYTPEELARDWCRKEEVQLWEAAVAYGRVTCHETRPRVDSQSLVVYPELIFRRYEGNTLLQTERITVPMRCHYPDPLLQLVADHGFRVTGRWGGYGGEAYGRGPELVIEAVAAG